MPIFDVGVVDGKIYVIGGTTRLRGERINRVDVYNPATDTWVKGPEMPTPRENLGVGVVGNRIYAIGGRGWQGFGPDLTVIEEYEPTSRQWRKKSDMLDARDWFAPDVVRDSIYLIGGVILGERRIRPRVFSECECVRSTGKMHGAIFQQCQSLQPQGAAAVNGRIYVFGGAANVGKGEELFPDVVVYDTGFRAVEANGKLAHALGKTQSTTPEKTLKMRNPTL